MTSPDAAPRSGGAPAAGEALALLQLIARHAGPSPAASLARELDLPRSTTYKLLGVLRDAGFVSHDATTRRWGLGPAAHELGSAYRRQAPLQRAAQGIVTELARHTGACAHLVVLHGQDVLYVLEERPLGVPPLVTDVGVRLPATVTASGLAILAALPSAQVRALFPRSEDLVQRQDAGAAPTTLGALRAELSRIRARGYAWEKDSVTPGFASVGCVVLDHNDLPAASIAVTWNTDAQHGTSPRQEAAAHDVATRDVAEACRASSEALSRRLRG